MKATKQPRSRAFCADALLLKPLNGELSATALDEAGAVG